MGSRKSSEGNVVSRSKSKLNGAAGEKNKEKQENAKKKLKKYGDPLNVAPRYHMWAKDSYSTLTIEANGAKWPVAT